VRECHQRSEYLLGKWLGSAWLHKRIGGTELG
jgi:hypothetical protein